MKKTSLDRSLVLPKKTFLLLGPRGVGKSTLLKAHLPKALMIDLLNSADYLELQTKPQRLRERLGHLKPGTWVVIDEIQRIPELLNEVHALYEEKKLNFALTGSSARKLRRSGANLLAGRALQYFLFPLTYEEYESYIDLQEAVDWGTLPSIVVEKEYRLETLATYVETYLRQELIEEGFIRKIDPFLRFLNVASIMNGQVLNFENIARDASIGRTTVQSYFEILTETLIGFMLPSYVPKLKVKETSKPKFYFFDSGVARACAGFLRENLSAEYRGNLFETFLVNQVKAYNHYSKKERLLAYYNISGSYEIDLIIEVKKKMGSQMPELVCIEIKSGTQWDSRWNKGIDDFSKSKKFRVRKKIGIYQGSKILSFNDFTVYPANEFLKRLFSGEIF